VIQSFPLSQAYVDSRPISSNLSEYISKYPNATVLSYPAFYQDYVATYFPEKYIIRSYDWDGPKLTQKLLNYSETILLFVQTGKKSCLSSYDSLINTSVKVKKTVSVKSCDGFWIIHLSLKRGGNP